MAFVGVVHTRRHQSMPSLSLQPSEALTRGVQTTVFYYRNVNFALSNASTHFSNANRQAAVILLYRQREKARTAIPAQSIQTTNRKKAMLVICLVHSGWRLAATGAAM